MNREQRKYILERIGNIAKCKREALMLGDADELLEKLASFEKKEF